ncbi:MAG: choice-of-anchor D domain-containing protein, partial [Calditrichaeota bacterium]|nr:choice-of-anchor D domain-containing protein [Calditrichota bacterium]
TGTGDLTVSAVELDEGAFSHDFGGETVLQPNGSLTIAVTFAPPAEGEFSATMIVRSDDDDEPAVPVELIGMGLEGDHFRLTVTGTNHSLLVTEALLDGNSLVAGDEIGVFTPGEFCAGATVIDEEGGLFPAGLAAYGDDPGTQAVDGFAAGQGFAFKVWDRASNQEVDATAIYSEGPQTWQQGGFTSLRLNAQTEAVPEIEIAEGDLSHDFGEVALGGASNWSFTIRNIGGATLMIHSITSSDEAFAVDFGEHVEIVPNEQVVVPVTFSPAEAIDYAGTLTVSSDDGDESSIEIALAGSGTELIFPEIALDRDQIDFGATAIGNEPTQALYITNEGTGDLTIFSVSIEGDNFTTDFGGEHVLAPDGILEVTITFAPTEERDYEATLVVESDDEDEGVLNVALTGSGFIGQHFEFVQTGASHSLLINQADIDGQSLVEGDEIGIFTPGGVCAGATTLAAGEQGIFPAGLAAWQDDPGTQAIDGFAAGQPFAFRLWDVSAQFDIAATAEYGEGPQTWANGGFTSIVRLFALTEEVPVIRLSTNAIDFGAVAVDDHIERTFTIFNIGTGTLTVGDIVVQGGGFTTNFDGEIGIGPQEDHTFSVFFSPDREGDFEGTLTIVNNDPANPEPVIALFGVGTEERIPDLSLSEESHDFGEVPVGEAGFWTLTIRNSGTGELVISSISNELDVFTTNWQGEVALAPQNEFDLHVEFRPSEITGYQDALAIASNDPDNDLIFVPLSGSGGQPGPHFTFQSTGENHSLLISEVLLDGSPLIGGDEVAVFTPDGLCAGAVVITGDEEGIGLAAWGDDPGQAGRQGFFANEAFSFRFWDLSAQDEIEAFPNFFDGPQRYTANGFTRLALVAEREATPQIAVTPDALQFGLVIAGETAELTLTVTNAGTADLTIFSYALEGSEAFSLANEGGEQAPRAVMDIVLEPRQTFNIPVTFSPAEPGEFAAELVIVSDDPENGEVRVPVAGIGVEPPPPDIALSAESHNFGEIALGNTASWELEVFNEGYLDLNVSEIRVSDEAFAAQPVEFAVARNGRQVVAVTFTPAGERDYEATLTIVSDDPDEGEVSVILTGSGITEGAPDIELSADSHDFGEVPLFESGAFDLTIRNVGNDVLQIAGYAVTDEAFSADLGELTLNPGGSQVVPVTFAPGEQRAYEATLTVFSDDPDESEYAVTLTGTGIAPRPHFGFTSTDQNHSLLITAALLNGESLVVGDEVGVFTPGGICAGAVRLEAGEGDLFPVGLAAWADDVGTQAVEGFRAGEAFSFKFWDADQREELGADPRYGEGPQTWTANGFTSLSLAAFTVAAPRIELSARAIDFSLLPIGSTRQRSLVIGNSGDANLTVSAVEFAGDGFTSDFEGEIALEPGAELTVVVTFAPEEARDYEATLTVVSDDPIEPRAEVLLAGQGVEAGPPRIIFSENAHEFGEILLGLTANWTFTVSNEGGEDLNVQRPEVVGAGFVVDRGEGFSLEPGASADLTVTFAPEEARDYDAVIIIRSNDPNRAAANIAVSGSGITGDFRWAFVTTDNNMSVLVEAADIDGQSLNLRDQIGVFTPDGLCAGAGVVEDFPLGLAAWGDDPSTERLDGFRNGEALAFRLWDAQTGFEGEAEATFLQGDNAYLANGFVRVTLSIFTGARRFNFTATDVGHELEIDDARIDEDQLGAGVEIGVFTPNNLCAGGVILEDFGEGLFPVRFTAWGDDEATGPVDGFQDGETFAFRFWDPTARREYAAEGNYLDGPDTWTADGFSLLTLQAASGRVPLLTLSADILEFNNVAVGRFRSRTLTVGNAGEAILRVGNIFSDNEVFIVDFEGEFTLEPGASADLMVTFAPTDVFDYAGQLHVETNDPERPEALVDVAGSGVEDSPARITVEPAALEFGEVLIGTGQSRQLIITASGGRDLEVSSIAVVGEGFVVDQPNGLIVESGAEGVVNVTFAPQQIGDYAAIAIIRSNDPSRPAVNVALSGVGMAGAFHWSFVETDNNLSLLVETAEIDGTQLGIRGQIGVFTPGGLCAGAVVIEEGFPVGFAAWGDDPSTQEVDGFAAGEALSFRLWDEAAGLDIAADPEYLTGNGLYVANGFLRLNLFAFTGGAHFNFVQTDVNHSLLVSEALLDGMSLVAGDEIGVFTTGGICAGASILEVVDDAIFPVGVAAWGDDANTQVIDGFRAGEAFAFRYWDGRTRREYNAFPEYLEGPEVFTANGFTLLRLSGRSGRAPDIFLPVAANDFRIVPVGGSRVWPLVIRNVGELNLTVGSVVSNTDGFSVAFSEEPAVIEPGGEIAVPVTFAPEEAREYAGTLTVFSDDPDEAEVNVNVTGIGIEAGPPHALLSEDRHDFGELLIGLRTTWTLNIANSGGSMLIVSSVVSTDESFLVDDPGETAIEPGDAFALEVVFAPLDEGDLAGQIRIATNDPDQEVVVVPVTGIGVRGALRWAIRQTDNNMSLLIENATLDGEPLGISDQIGVFSLGGLPVGAVEITDQGFPVGLAAWGDDPSTEELDGMQTGETFQFRIWDFSADLEVEAAARYLQGEGRYVANGFALLTLSSFSPQEGNHFQFVETDNNHSLLVRAATLDGDPLMPGDEVGVLTPGRIVAGGFLIEEAGAEFGFSAWGDDPTTENVVEGFLPGQSFTFKVWDYRAREEFTAAASFEDGTDFYQVNGFSAVRLSAVSGRVPMIVLADNAHDFGGVEIGTAAEWALVIFNRGNATLHIESVSFEGDDAFAVGDPRESEVAPDGATFLMVQFAPREEADFAGQVTILSDDPDRPEMTVDLAGRGIVILRPDIAVDRQVIDFGDVALFTTAVEVLTISNEGEGELLISDMFTDNPLFTVAFQREPQEFYWTFRGTDNNMSLLIQDARLRDDVIAVGDVVGVFGTTGVCAGYMAYEGEFPLGMAVWGDDSSTPERDGMQAGEELNFRFWDTEAGREYVAVPEYSEGDGRYSANGFFVLMLSSQGRPLSPGAVAENVIEPGASLEILVNFSPEETGEQTGVLTIVSSDADESEVLVDLVGVGMMSPPELVIAPSSFDYGTLLAGEESSQAFTLTNIGMSDLVVEEVF